MEKISSNIPVLDTAHDYETEEYSVERVTCRGIIVEDNRILLSHETVEDDWLIPGGGLEENETLEECCIREVEEEMGFTVRPINQVSTVNLYFKMSKTVNVSHYFECEIISECERRLLDYEIEVGITPEWLELDKALRIFSKYELYRKENISKYYLYSREFLALEHYMKLKGII